MAKLGNPDAAPRLLLGSRRSNATPDKPSAAAETTDESAQQEPSSDINRFRPRTDGLLRPRDRDVAMAEKENPIHTSASAATTAVMDPPAEPRPKLRETKSSGMATLLASSEHLLKPNDGPDLRDQVSQLHDTLLDNLDLEKLNDAPEDESKALVEEAVRALINASSLDVYGDQRERLVRMVLDEVLGFGPIQPLLDNPEVQEVMVNAPDQVYIEVSGVMQRTDVRFRDDGHVRRVAERILSIIGRRVDEASPMVDARLKDGSRVNITVPPASPKHPTITIRKFRQDRFSLDELRNAGSLDERMSEFLGACAAHKLNILISGGTGSGKTTMLNAISSFIPRTERIITIEDPLELALQQPHVIALEARPADMMGRHAITQRDLLRNTLRMRPDRIIVGEIRGPEAFEMLQAMNTGHDGSLGTVHANTPRDALSRVENMVLMAGFELPITAIREQIASALDLVVQLQRFGDGVRRVTAITEVTGMEGGSLTMQDIYTFEVEGRTEDGKVLGAYRPTGLRPAFSDEMAARGRPLQPELFLEGAI